MSTSFFNNNCADEVEELESAKQYADLARDWAIKMDGLVDGIDFSSKYWALQSAEGAGLSVTIKEGGTPLGDDFTVLNFGAGVSATQTTTNEVLIQSTGQVLVETFDDGVGFIAGTSEEITLATEVVSKNNIDIYFDGHYQNKETYDVSGILVTFDSIIPVGVSEIEVVYPRLMDVGVTSADNVTFDGSTVDAELVSLDSRLVVGEAALVSIDSRLTIVERSTLVNRPFPNVAAVVTATFLQTGDFVEWLGYTTAGDGGGNKGEIGTGFGPADNGSVFDLSGSGLQARALLSTKVDIRQFGAPTDQSDAISYITNAIAYLDSVGGGTLVGGDILYKVSSPMTVINNITYKALKVKRTDGSTDDRIIALVPGDPSGGKENIKILRCEFSGLWDEIRREEGVNGIITLKYCSDILIEGCKLHYARNFTINTNLCQDITVRGCSFLYGARDFCANWNSTNLIVEGNRFEGNDDDGISVNSESDGTEPSYDSVIIRNNILKDTGGIRSQVMRKCVIDGNILDRCKGTAIRVSALNNAGIDEGPPHNIIVVNNIITNKIDRTVSVDGGSPGINNRIAIMLESIGLDAGVLSAVPGYNDPTTGQVVAPYEYFNTVGVPYRASSFIQVENNIVKRTLPIAANYSDYGYGEIFTRFSTDLFAPTGFVDPQITDDLLQCLPLDVRGPFDNLSIKNNKFYGSGANSIRFIETDGEIIGNYDLRRIEIKNNDLGDAIVRGIEMSQYSGTKQDVLIQDNTIDCDPYIRAAGRDETGGVYSGAWVSQTSTVAVYVSSVEGIKIFGNHFKNCSSPYIQGGAANMIPKSGNFIYSQPVTIGFSTSNLGVGTIPDGAQKEAKVIYVDSGPTSATYGDILAQTLEVAPGLPSVGFYTEGYILPIRTINTVTFNGVDQTIFAYVRLTTGTAHVVDTDWKALYSEIT